MTTKDYKSDTGIYLIPISWEVYSTIQVEADNLEDAIERANEYIEELPLPTENEYIDGSFRINIESDEEAINAQSYATIGSVILHKDGTIEK